MRHYELLFVLRPTLTEEEALKKVDFIKEVLEKNCAEIATRLDMGTRKLAYPIKKFERGLYTVFYFKAPTEAIKELERIIRINEEIIKFMTVKFETKTEIANWEKAVAKNNKVSTKETKKVVVKDAETEVKKVAIEDAEAQTKE